MFDIWFGKVELTEVIIYLSILILIPLQLFLCFKANNKALKLLPVGILLLLIVIFFIIKLFLPRYYLIECSNYCNGVQEEVLDSKKQSIISKSISNNTIKYLISVKENRESSEEKNDEYLEESFMIQKNDSKIRNLSSEIMNGCKDEKDYILKLKDYFKNKSWCDNYSLASLFSVRNKINNTELKNFDAIEAISLSEMNSLSATNLFIALSRAQKIPAKIILAFDVKNNKYTFYAEVYIDGKWEKVMLKPNNENEHTIIILAEGKDLLEDIPLTNTPSIKVTQVSPFYKLPDSKQENIIYRISSIYEKFYDEKTMNSFPQSIINLNEDYLDVSFDTTLAAGSFDYKIEDYFIDDSYDEYLKSTKGINLEEIKIISKEFENFENVEELILSVFQWMRYNIIYDANLAVEYSNGEKRARSVKEILEEKTGVCSDYAALFAAILRSKGIPVKIVEGNYLLMDTDGHYSLRTTHAWNEVYSFKVKKWIPVDPQSSCLQLNPSYIKYFSGLDFEDISGGNHSLKIYDMYKSNIESIDYYEQKLQKKK